MRNPAAKNSRPAHTFFRFTRASFIADRISSEKLLKICEANPRHFGCEKTVAGFCREKRLTGDRFRKGDFLQTSCCFETRAKDQKSPPSFVVSARLAKNTPFTLAAATGAAAGKSRPKPAARDSSALRHFDKSLRE